VKLAVREAEVPIHDPAAAGRIEAESLALRAAACDPDAWAEIFERHYRTVFAFIRFRLHDADEAEDIAAQAFEIAFSRAGHFDYRGVPIEAWLIGIARNLVRAHVKKLRRRPLTHELAEDASVLGSDATSLVDLHQDIGVAMRQLTEDQQTVLSLRFLLDKSVTDTARLMDRSEAAVKNLQRRALAAMQRALSHSGYREEQS